MQGSPFRIDPTSDSMPMEVGTPRSFAQRRLYQDAHADVDLLIIAHLPTPIHRLTDASDLRCSMLSLIAGVLTGLLPPRTDDIRLYPD
jgi:hypothetical protein